MFNTNLTRRSALTAVLVSFAISTLANAQPEQQSGKRRGPPPEAREACADLRQGAVCSFSGHRGEVTGTCIVPPHTQEQLVCAPEGGPPEHPRETPGDS